MPDISDEELQKLQQVAGQRRGGKPIKYMELAAHRDSILKAMQRDIPLSVILEWLRESRDISVVLNTLRKYVVKQIGRDFYNEYLHRNGWIRSSKQPLKPAAAMIPRLASESTNPPVRIDVNKSKPPTYQRTERK